MSERGLPIPDGAPACPFVAFEDDRDARSTAPDHRHRCFAEKTPAPRALAHQDAYCLSSAFPVCPAFQDWARREAAPPRRETEAPVTPGAAAGPPIRPPAGPAPTSAPPLTPFSTVAPPPPPPPPAYPDGVAAAYGGDGPGMTAWTGRPGERSAAAEGRRPSPTIPAIPAAPGRRVVPRDWAAPPPWADDDEALHPADDPASPSAIPGWTSAPQGQAGRSPARDVPADRSLGLAGSDLERLVGPDPAGPAARPAAAYMPQAGMPAGSMPRREPPMRQAIGPASPSLTDVPGREPVEPRDAHEQRTAAELFGPAWEQPRKFEAYPSLRTRVGLPSFAGVPPVAVGAVALVAAAMVLFFIGPMLLGIGGKNTGSASPVPIATAAATPTPLPTATPAPTSTVYTVAKGDTATRIATKFGITVDQLRAANPQLKDPNKLQIGDQLVIPAPVATEVSGVGGASPSP